MRVQTGLLGAVLLLPLAVGADVVPNGPAADAQKELQQIQQELGRFEEASKDYKGTVKHIVQQEYVEKRRQVMGKFQSQIDREEGDEKVRRVSAITLFENFLQKYPNDERWTPDAMFRLAELYFEKSNDEYLPATAAANQTGA